MKTMFKQILAAMVLSLALPGLASAVTLTFDDLGLVFGDTFVGNEYAGFGVNFATPDVRLGIGSTTGSSPNSMGAHTTFGDDFDGTIQMNFTPGFFVDDLSFTIFNTPFSAQAFDVGGFLLHTINSGPEFTQFFDFSGFEVNSVTMTGTFYAMDDVMFGDLTGTGAPEPATLALLGLGLAIGLGRRKRR